MSPETLCFLVKALFVQFCPGSWYGCGMGIGPEQDSTFVSIGFTIATQITVGLEQSYHIKRTKGQCKPNCIDRYILAPTLEKQTGQVASNPLQNVVKAMS